MSSMSMKRSKHLRFSVAARCLCLAGLALAVIPATASASPLAVQAPSLTSIVGLGKGAQGNEVKTVQTALLAAGVKVPGGADGNFGPATTSAVVAFQARKGLPPTGSIDEGTAAALGLAAATTPASSSAGGLTAGAQGPTVTELQQALMAAGVFVAGGADGVFGKGTTTAVSNYQRWNALAVTGIVDATTSSRLKLGTGAVPATPAAAPAPAVAPAAASNPTFSGMTVGARGDNVKVLQRALIAAGSSVRGGADGVFGAMTASALTAYQQAKGLSATGLVDDATIASLALSPAAPTPAASPTPAPTPAPNPVAGLKLGAMGDSVKQLQRALMKTGLVLRGGADGSFGNATNTALMAFQKTNGTAQTGVLTEQEANVLGLGSGGAAAPQGISAPSGFAIYGERGDRVTAVQKSLIAAGLSFSGGADGMFGAATTNAIMEFQRRSGLAATGKLDDATAAKLGAVAAPAPAAPSSAGVAMEVFPMQGQCWFGDTWQAPRSGGRLHEGTDVIGPKGKLLYAVVSGTISKQYFDRPGSPAGNGVRVQQDNGTYFTYLHMDTFADGIAVGTIVTAGQVIGTVGATGAASPHLHFEVHPNGGGAVNPYPLLKAIDACNVSAPRS